MNIFFVIRDLLVEFINYVSEIVTWFITPIEIGSLGSITPFSAMFGAGLVVVLGVIIAKWIV